VLGAATVAAVLRFAYVSTAPVAIWYDSHGYEAVGSHPILSGALWSGKRSPLAPLLWHLTGSPRAYVNVQTLIAALAWGLLASTAARLFQTPMRSVLAALLILSFSLSPYILQWSASVLTESLALSAVALASSFAILIATDLTWVRAGGLVVSLAMFALVRDQGVFVAIAVGIAVLLGTLVAAVVLRPRKSEQANRLREDSVERPAMRTSRWLSLGFALLVVGAASGAGAYVSHRNDTNVEDNLSVRVFPFPGRVAWFASHGMPEARQIDVLAARELTAALHGPTRRELLTGRITAPAVYFTFTVPMWHQLREWVGDRGEATYAKYLVSHPAWAIDAPFSPTTTAVAPFLSYYADGHPVPGWAGWIWFPGPLLAATGILGLAVLIWQRRVTRFVVLFCGVTLLGLVTAWVAWLSAVPEVNRHMIEGNVTIRLGVLLIAELAFLGWRRAPSSRAALPVPDREEVTV
jgi:hypothetical protein